MSNHSEAIDAIIASITGDVGIAVGAGFSVLAVVLAARVGMGLVKSFIRSGV